MFNWEDVRAFHALAERRTLEGAARSLGVGVGTVHRRVAALEEAIGARLFVRGKSGHVRTEAGDRLFEQSSEIAAMLGTAQHEIGGRDADLRGSVRITTTESAADYIIVPQVASFREAFPHIVLELDARPDVVTLVDERPSIALRFVRPERGDFTLRGLGQKSCSLFASEPLHRELVRENPDGPWRTAPHIGWSGAFHNISLAKFSRKYFASPPSFVVGTIHAHLEAARAGLGIAHLPRFVAGQASDLIDLMPGEQTVSLSGWMVIPRVLRHMARVDVTASFIADAYAQAPL